MLRALAVLVALLGLSAGACVQEPDYAGRLCWIDAPCPEGFVCDRNKRCRRPSADTSAESGTDSEDTIILDSGLLGPATDGAVTDSGIWKPSDQDAAGPDAATPIDASVLDAGHPGDSGRRMDAGASSDAGFPPVQVAVAVADSADDALQDPGGPVLAGHPWISLYSDDHFGALRFRVLGLPRSAVIIDAYVELYVDSAEESNPSTSIQVDPDPNGGPIQAWAYGISGRPRSNLAVPWLAYGLGEGWARTPSLSHLVQSVVDHPAFGPASSITVIFDSMTPQVATAFEFRQWDYGFGAFAPRLVLRYLP